MGWNATPLSLTWDEEFWGVWHTPSQETSESKYGAAMHCYFIFLVFQMKLSIKDTWLTFIQLFHIYHLLFWYNRMEILHLNLVPHTLQIVKNILWCFCAVLQLVRNPDRGVFLEICNKGELVGQSTNTFDTLFKWVEPTLASWWGGI